MTDFNFQLVQLCANGGGEVRHFVRSTAPENKHQILPDDHESPPEGRVYLTMTVNDVHRPGLLAVGDGRSVVGEATVVNPQ